MQLKGLAMVWFSTEQKQADKLAPKTIIAMTNQYPAKSLVFYFLFLTQWGLNYCQQKAVMLKAAWWKLPSKATEEGEQDQYKETSTLATFLYWASFISSW